MVKALRLVSGVAVFDARSGPENAANRRGDGEFGSLQVLLRTRKCVLIAHRTRVDQVLQPAHTARQTRSLPFLSGQYGTIGEKREFSSRI